MPNWSRCLRQRRSKFMMTLCANGLSCFAHPLLNSNVTSLSCDTQADALARIQTLGVDGGFDGNGAGLNDTSSTAATSSMMATSTVASSSSSATGTASANSATMMAIWIVRMTIVMIVRTRMPLRLPLARHTLPFPTIIVPFASASSSFSSTAAFNPNATVAFDSDFSTITIDNPCGKASASAVIASIISALAASKTLITLKPQFHLPRSFISSIGFSSSLSSQPSLLLPSQQWQLLPRLLNPPHLPLYGICST